MEANEQVLAYLNQNLNKKIADGNPRDVRSNPIVQTAYFGDAA
jgi:ABC-type branched-subunit amino acid transport system ATPase component